MSRKKILYKDMQKQHLLICCNPIKKKKVGMESYPIK